MRPSLSALLDTSDFPPRWHCGNWTDVHGWVHITSDLAIFGAYMAIPVVLGYFIRKRPDVPFLPVFWLFAAFILACGTTHLLEAVIFWHPVYRFAGLVKFVTAVVSWVTVIALVPTIQRALAMKSITELEADLRHHASELGQQHDLNRQLAAIIATSGYAVVGTKTDGTITHWNTAAAKLYGWSEDEVLGRPLPTLLAENNNRQQPEDGRIETQHRRKDGTVVDVALSIVPIEDQRGALVGAAMVTHDISERKRSDTLLAERTAALERSNHELQTFAYAASHDLQEPLRTIGGYLQLIERRYRDKLDDDARDFIDFAVQGASRMQALIEALLSYSRITTRGEPLVAVDLDDVLEQVIDSLQLRVAESGAFIERSTLPRVLGDPIQLRQVLQNLLTNAIRFAGEAPPRIEFLRQERGTQWLIGVKDHGIGFEPRFAERIFEMFQRLHGREVPGTGMGLALCKRIIERHGGQMWAESTPGDGTTIWFTLSQLPPEAS